MADHDFASIEKCSLRTSELQNAITEISPKVLTETLRGMERDGLIRRDVHAVLPPRVEYCLTSMGASLLKPLEDLCHWARAHVAERDRARAQFDSSDSALNGKVRAAASVLTKRLPAGK